MDIGWFGLLSGSSLNFLNVYATRLGASGLQIGLLGAMTALINLILAIPAGRWIEKRAVGKAVFWTSVLYRAGFLAWVFLPWVFQPNSQAEIWALILVNFLMGIPLAALGVGFNALFAASVPTDWRAHVAGVRNIVLSITFMATSLFSGYLLERLPFPGGYQLIFLMGFVGAAMSSVHLYFIRPILAPALPESPSLPTSARRGLLSALRLDIWKTRYRAVMLVFFGFHLTQYLAVPVFPLYFVRTLRLTDEQIGIGTAIFYLTVLIGSTQLPRLVRRLGHKNVSGYGLVGMGLYPLLLSVSTDLWHYYGVSAIGGVVWAMLGGAYANYLLENIPEQDRPAHLAWYSITANACVLIGSLAGPALAEAVGLSLALITFGALRVLAGFAMLKWG